MAMSQLSQIVDQHVTQSEISSTSLRNEIITRIAESHRKTDVCYEKAKVVTRRVDHMVELLEKEERNKREELMKRIELRRKKLEDKARKGEEKKKTEG